MAEKKRTGVREPRFSVEPCAALKRNPEYPLLPAPDGAPPRRPALSGGDFPVTKEGYTTPAPKNRSTGFL